MNTIAPLNTTGNGQIDGLLRGVIGRFEAAFPARIRRHYLKGATPFFTFHELSTHSLLARSCVGPLPPTSGSDR